jgi:hypothetical protein
MFTEKGTLIIGVEYEGKTHTEFELRPQIVADSVDAMEDEKARRNDSYLGLIVVSRQLTKLGDIPKDQITAELLMTMQDIDMTEINDALKRLQVKQNSFRRKSEVPT